MKNSVVHILSQPHGVMPDDEIEPTYKKVTVQAIDIKGIMYYLDTAGNVYDTNDIIHGIKNPKIIAKYKHEDGVYSIPEFGI